MPDARMPDTAGPDAAGASPSPAEARAVATVDTVSTLRNLYGEPSPRAARKVLSRLDKHCRAFIGLSPFLVIGTASADGRSDVSPRGDAPGFVAVLDDRTLLLPDRLGNNRVDTLSNVVENPNVGLLFFVPGMNETLRINGTASVVTDPGLLEPLAAGGKVPASGLLIRVDEAFLHCAKALIRSKLWEPESRIDRGSFPSMGRMLADQIGLDVAETERLSEESIRTRLY